MDLALILLVSYGRKFRHKVVINSPSIGQEERPQKKL